MKKIVNDRGFKKAMRAGKTWVTLDCQLSELENGNYYFEIDKHVFTGNPEEGVKGKGDANWEQLASGEGFDLCETIWSNLIEKYNPDEYFVNQTQL